MSPNEAVLRSMQRTLAQSEDFTRCGQPFPGWLVKQLKGLDLLGTDWEAGLALYIDGLQDEDDAVQESRLSRYPDGIEAEEDAIQEAEFHE